MSTKVKDYGLSDLQLAFAEKLTENGDKSFSTTGNKLLDILFMTEYYQKHLDLVRIGDSDTEKLFSMFIRDARYGLGRRDLGRQLMYQSGVQAEDVVKAGRYDDLIHFIYYYLNESICGYNELNGNVEQQREYCAELESRVRDFILYIVNKAKEGDYLAKKWLPRRKGKHRHLAGYIKKVAKISDRKYRDLIKNEDTTEYKLSYCEFDIKPISAENSDIFPDETDVWVRSHPLIKDIEYDKVESLAMIKYYNTFMRKDTERFQAYLEDVKKGIKKLNVSTTNAYDIYRNRGKIDPDLFFDKLEKIALNCIPIVDTSGSMDDMNDSMGKALAIGHYLAKCSTYAPNMVVSFSSQPVLIELGVDKYDDGWNGIKKVVPRGNTQYMREIDSMITGDCTDTNFGAVMDRLSKLSTYPEYLVVLSDMEFNEGSTAKKDEVMKSFKARGANTKIVWWNFNARNATSPETDDYGNIYLSGYSPQLLKYLEAGFDGNQFLDKLLEEYKNKIYPSKQ